MSLGLSHSKSFNQKPLQHGTMSKKKKEWRAEKGERLLGSAHFRLANALLHLNSRARLAKQFRFRADIPVSGIHTYDF